MHRVIATEKMGITRIGLAATLTMTALVFLIDYRFLGLRCEFSPSISAIGVCVSIAVQTAGLLVFASCFESEASRAAAKFPRLPKRQVVYLSLCLLIFGLHFMHVALLTNDAFAVHGSRSSGEACPDPHW